MEVSMIKKTLISLLFASASLQMAHAQEITGGIQVVQKEVKQHIQDRVSVNYPLYPDLNQALRELEIRFDKVMKYSLPELVKIEERAHQFQKELDTFKDNYAQTHSAVFQKMIEQKEKVERPKMVREFNSIYQDKIKDLITVWQDFVVVTGIKKHKTDSEWRDMSGITHDYTMLDNFGETMGSRPLDLGLIYYMNMQFNELKKKDAIDNTARFNWEQSGNMFWACKTQGCIFELAEDIKQYFGIISKINQKITLIPGIELMPVNFLQEQSILQIDVMAKTAIQYKAQFKD